MRSWKVLVFILCMVAMASIAMAKENSMGIHEVSHVTFAQPTRVGGVLLPAGDYVVRHTMVGQDHIMVFQGAKGKAPEVKVKCTLVPLGHVANQTQAVSSLNAANERVLQELVFRGDTAKHVFQAGGF
jgi:hypothetical protein